MVVAVLGDHGIQSEFENKGVAEGVEIHFILSLSELSKDTHAIFYLLNEQARENDLNGIKVSGLLTFVHAVTTTADFLPANCVRINSWPGFLGRSTVEICASPNNIDAVADVMNTLGWKYTFVPDVTGMVSARIVAMIINEAYFALEDEVADRTDIDTAMKLGTNYPYGPFEWAAKIGLRQVISLLNKLAETDGIYTPSSALLKEIHY